MATSAERNSGGAGAASPDTAGRRRGRSRSALPAILRAAAVVAVLALSASARARADADADADVRRTMEDRLFFVHAFRRGWEPLLEDFAGQLATIAEADRTPVLAVRDDAMEKYADFRLEDGSEAGQKRAFDLFESLSREAVAEARRPQFARRCAEIEVKWAAGAEKAGDDERALGLALSAARRSPGFEPAYELIARLGIKQADKAEARDDFIAALKYLGDSAALLPDGAAAKAKVVERRDQILASTGEVQVQWLGNAEKLAAVRGPKTDYSNGRIEFRPLEGQKAGPLQPVGGPIRIRKGRHDVVVQGAGSTPFRAGQIDLPPSGATITILLALPENMVYVPATGGQEAFLIDRTEVTQTEFSNPGGGNVGGNRTAAAGVSWGAAKRYADLAGKDLPSYAQWQTAAFGDPQGRSRKFPWGDTPGRAQQHFVGDVDGPQSVDSCGSFPSAAGCLNMAGNVWEWLAEQRFIGGSFKRATLTLEITMDDNSPPWTADFLRDAAPSPELYEDDRRMPPQERVRFRNYRLKSGADGQNTLDQIGLRCVVSLGTPWRKP